MKEGPTEENVELSVRAQEAETKKILLLLIFGQKNELNVSLSPTEDLEQISTLQSPQRVLLEIFLLKRALRAKAINHLPEDVFVTLCSFH